MPKRNSVRRTPQGQSSPRKRHRSRSSKARRSRISKAHRSRISSPEPAPSDLIMPGLTRDQWLLVLDPCHRTVALRLALTIANHVVNTDALMRAAQEALIAAVRVYDPSRGMSFFELASRRMRQAMSERVREKQIPERFLRWRRDLLWLVTLHEQRDEP